MTLAAGTRLGAYEITGPLGAGGMGEVYRARDTVLERDVAIKVLPESFAADADRVARFEREAKTLASLNHANIAQVFGLEKSGGTTAIVMELVEGPTLADRIAAGPLAPDEALSVARQIADALEAAHGQGIVHRDLKPANVKLKPDGTVKVLDFGIAKAIDLKTISGQPAQMTTPAMTQAGVILGTAAYMSPEQARGRLVDERTDVWAFGCLLFEMLTGQPAFGGEDLMATLARVIDRDTDLSSMPGTLSPAVRHTIKLCLEKNPAKRIADIRDVRLALEGRFESELGRAEGRPEAAPRWRRLLPVAAALVLGVVVGAGVWTLRPADPPARVTRFTDAVPPLAGLGELSISDDGTRIGFVVGSPPVIHVRSLDDFDSVPIADSVGRAVAQGAPCFSPDGSWIAYVASGQTEIRKAPIGGGRGLTLAEGLSGQGSATCDWGDDGYVYFGGAAGIARVPDAGGPVERLTSTTADERAVSAHQHPQLLPGGDRVLFSIVAGGGALGSRRVAVVDLETRSQTIVLESAGVAAFAPTGASPTTGHLVYGQDGALFAAPFDVSRLEAGPSNPVLDGVMGIAGVTWAAVADTGTLAYFSGDIVGLDPTLNRVDRDGAVEAIEMSSGTWGEVALSPDGRRVTTGMLDLQTLDADLWSYDFDGGRLTRTTFGGFNGSIVWTPDGTRLIYAAFADVTTSEPSIRVVPADNSGPPVTIAELTAIRPAPTSISPDGSVLMGTNAGSAGGATDVWTLALDGRLDGSAPATDADVAFLTETGFSERHPTFSPDGRWIAYSSNESGVEQIYVVPYPGPGGKFQVSTDGGRQPRWDPDGSEIFYLSGPRMMAVDVAADAGFRAANPRVLFENAALIETANANVDGFQYAVAPNGGSFLILGSGGTGGRNQRLRVVENWFEELRRLVPQ